MRSLPLRLLIVAALAAAPVTEVAAQARKAPAAKAAPKIEPPPPPPDPENKIKTSDELKRENVQGAMTAPLRDLNVTRAKIPPILLDALADPYKRPPNKWRCTQLVGLVRPLDEALGPDIDRILPGDENLMDRSKSTALGVAADFASDAIPFRGWVRKLSGAEAHDKLVQSAIIAGNVRRAYLKGLGEARGCPPPATPSHERAGTPPVKAATRPGPDTSRFSPKYPTR
ncbi:MAG: hypothetical protein AB1942_15610 [Pseudomonadota bacterium]